MDWQGWFTLGVLVLVVAGLIREVAGPEILVMAGLLGLAAAGILTPPETFSGFANPALAAVGALFVVSAGLRETGAIEAAVVRLFGRARTEGSALARMCPPLAATSAFLNNAPIVAMMTPVVIDWARRHAIAPSRLLIPLSYATMLGSVTTLIGTSVNLTVAGLLPDAGMAPMLFFELAPVGVPVCVVGLLYVLFVAPRWIPTRQDPAGYLGKHRREYVASMGVEPGCRLVDQTVEEAGLRQLPGLFLVEIDRGGHVITPVGPDQTIAAGDRLVFAGVVSTIVDLQRIPGLVPLGEGEEQLVAGPGRRLVEAVVSRSSPLVNRSVREASFRSAYDAAVVAVHRNGERVGGKIGEIVLLPGDTLLLQTAPHFLRTHGGSPDFYLVSEVDADGPPRLDRAPIAIAILVAMVALVVFVGLHISIAAFLAGGALIATRCLSASHARRSVDWSVLIVIGAGLGIAGAMTKTGAAAAIAELIVAAVGAAGPLATLTVVYATTVILSELVHHAAAAAIMFPIAVASATQVGADPRGFVMAIAVAATCAFANPVTYQTHLIVYGPGGYRFTDFLRVGLPLDLIVAVVALLLIPWIWPFAV
jgi:di/tricarboxylate transporter